MRSTTILVVLALTTVLAVAQPTNAEVTEEDTPATCVKLFTNPVGAAVDPGCVYHIIEEIPLAPRP